MSRLCLANLQQYIQYTAVTSMHSGNTQRASDNGATVRNACMHRSSRQVCKAKCIRQAGSQARETRVVSKCIAVSVFSYLRRPSTDIYIYITRGESNSMMANSKFGAKRVRPCSDLSGGGRAASAKQLNPYVRTSDRPSGSIPHCSPSTPS